MQLIIAVLAYGFIITGHQKMGRKESQLKRLQKECDALSHALQMKNEGRDEEIAPRFQKWSKSKLRKN